MEPRVWVKKLNFQDGTEIQFEKNDIVIIVGPNNVGKSLCLKEINGITYSNPLVFGESKDRLIIKELELSKEGNLSDVIDKYQSTNQLILNPNTGKTTSKYYIRTNRQDLARGWKLSQGLGPLRNLMVGYINTIDRLKSVDPPKSTSLIGGNYIHPIHFLQRDDELEMKFCNYFQQAFGQDLVVNRSAGDNVPIHVGIKPTIKDNEDRVSISYVTRLEKLPFLHVQGDGMKSFVGVLLNSFAMNYSVLLVDEPDVFLHPPQSKLLGRMIGKDLPQDRQMFISTHSGDFLRGILDSGNKNVRVIRIEREGSTNRICELNKEDLSQIWIDPILRYSNILDGVFHSEVIICESDSDCRFYSAILNAIVENEGLTSPDVMFVHCGGKHRVPKIVNALSQLKVKVKVIVDFDILNNIQPIQSIIKELGGDWDLIKNKWKSIKQTIDSKRPELETSDIKKAIAEILEETNERIFPNKSAKKINSLLKKISAWSSAKEVGKHFIPNGQPTKDFKELTENLNQLGLFIVEIGELESFCKSVSNHGPKWVIEVLNKDLILDPELEEARKFIKKIVFN